MDALRHQDHAGEPGGRHLSGRGIHRQYGGSAGAQHAGVGVRGPVRRGPAHQPGGGPAGAAVCHHPRRRSGRPGGGCVRSAHGKAQSADCGAAGERRPGGGGLSDGAPGGLVHAGGGRIHPVFRRWEKLGQCGGSGQSEGTQGRYRPARPRRVRRQRDGFLHCRRNGPVGAVHRRPDCGGYRRGGRTPCQLEEKNRRHPERPGLRGQG